MNVSLRTVVLILSGVWFVLVVALFAQFGVAAWSIGVIGALAIATFGACGWYLKRNQRLANVLHRIGAVLLVLFVGAAMVVGFLQDTDPQIAAIREFVGWVVGSAIAAVTDSVTFLISIRGLLLLIVLLLARIVDELGRINRTDRST